MTTSEPAPIAGQIDEREAAVRRVLGYPAEGPIPTVGHYPNGQGYVRVLYTVVPNEATFHIVGWHNLIARTWCRLLAAAGVPVDGPTTAYRCPCVEAALRVYLIEQLSRETADDGYEPSEFIVEASKTLDYRTVDGMHRWEREAHEIAGYSFPALAVADASGLRIARGTYNDLPRSLVDHARSCRIPYPVNVVVRRMSKVGDES